MARKTIGVAALFIGLLAGVACPVAGDEGPVAPPAPWFLCLRYEAGGLDLLDARRIPPMLKKPFEDPAGWALERVPYTLAWLDAGGKVLQQARADIPLGVRVPPEEGDSQAGFIPDSNVFWIRAPGPAVGQVAARLRLDRTEFARAFSFEGHIPALPALVEWALPVSGPVAPMEGVSGPEAIRKVRDSGPDGNRLVLVMMGDGYLEADIAAGVFSNHVASFLTALQGKPPWDVLLPVANVYQIDVTSNERGADYEDASPSAGGTLKDTYLHASFWYDNVTERLLSLRTTGSSRAVSAANTYVGIGAWDSIVVLVNSTKYGGAGGSIAVSSVNSAGPEIAAHEIGHSFAGCADEYHYGDGTTYTGGNPGQPNIDIHPTNAKWNVWIETGTPLPTPDTSAYNTVVGAFEGAYYKQYGIYRPWRNCKMKALDNPFCPVCQEAHLVRYFQSVSLLDARTPSGAEPVDLAGATTFLLECLPLAGVEVGWRLNGESVGLATNAHTLIPVSLTAPTGTLEAVVSYHSSKLRRISVSETFSWAVENTAVTDRGTPHWWLGLHGLDPAVGGDDYDEGDGAPAWKEYRAGTDPSDGSSVLRLEDIQAAGTNRIVIQWQSVSNRTYHVQHAPELIGGFNETLASNILGQPPVNTHTVNVGAASQGFWRIGVGP